MIDLIFHLKAVTRIALALLALNLNAKAFAETNSDRSPSCVAIDGPAYLRDKPDGKTLRDLPQKALVEMIEKNGPWLKVGTRKNSRGAFTCYNDNLGPLPIEGWAHEKNIRQLSNLELAKIDPCVVSNTAAVGGEVFSAEVVQQDCSCAEFSRQYHDATDCSLKVLKKGFFVGGECSKDRDFTICNTSRQDINGATTLQCPNSCLSLNISNELSEEARISKLNTDSEKSKGSYKKALPSSLFAELQNSHPAWVPYFEDRMSSKYEMNLKLSPFYINMNLKGKKEVLWVVLFFENPKDYIHDQLTWLFWKSNGSAKGKAWSSQVLYKLKSKGSEGNTQICMIQTLGPNAVQILIADAPSDESHLGQGAYSLKDVFNKGPIPISDLKDPKKEANQFKTQFGIKNVEDWPKNIEPTCEPAKL